MKLIHLSDLHLGRNLCEFSLIDVQRAFLQDVLTYIDEHAVDAVMLCGDVYDRTAPPAAAIMLLNEFLSGLNARSIPVLMISGNHDSPERLAFLSDLLTKSRVYIAGNYALGAPPVTLKDAHGPVNFYLLPFFRPGAIRAQLPDETIAGYDDAIAQAVSHMNVDASQRNVLLAHQFVCAPGQAAERSDSEMLFAGGTEQVSSTHFDAFDYVALGHLHRAQRVGRETVRYAGAPLHYALSEAGDKKSFTVVELGAKGEVSCEQVPVRPLRALRPLRGTLAELLSAPCDRPNDFYSVTLTDTEAVYDAMRRLRARYPFTVHVKMERDQSPAADALTSLPASGKQDLLTLFEGFFEETAGRALTEREREEIVLALKQDGEEEESPCDR